MGWRSLLAQTVTHRNSEARAFKPEAISAFTSDPALFSFADYFCKPTVNMGQAVRRLERREMSETFELWQIKLVLEFFSSRSHQERMSRNPNRGLFMNSEFLPVMKCTIDNTLDQWLQGNTNFSELLLKFKQLNMPVRALLRLAPLLLRNPQSMVL
ncbi:hypothetical protein llap_19097 [Limosa lapponica baueri]|uniref:Anaphase-promoting complex subunit 1 C-terminal domain-containing protein n=1 Tax=Limosa lapponica baueri TaxID=1758121 RepID=A0A2I0T9X5_LIMLA|nr:hypothetical protein llap_19097 [Limosa lapponica baueri]